MNILSLSRSEVVAFVESGFMKQEEIRHYDICLALKEGKKQREIAEKFNIPEDRLIRYIKSKKCPDCGGLKKGRPVK